MAVYDRLVLEPEDMEAIRKEAESWKKDPKKIFDWSQRMVATSALILEKVMTGAKGRSGAQNIVSSIRLLSGITEQLMKLRDTYAQTKRCPKCGTDVEFTSGDDSEDDDSKG
jgi:hypothetical protein